MQGVITVRKQSEIGSKQWGIYRDGALVEGGFFSFHSADKAADEYRAQAAPFPAKNDPSPWGAIQHATVLAPGLVSVSTASHGGIWLAPDRLRVFEAAFPGFRGYSGAAHWLEEDCDYSLAVLLWPDVFGDEAVFYAVRLVAGYEPGYFDSPKAWLASGAGESVRAIHNRFAASRVGLWERGGCSTSGKGWSVFLYRGEEMKVVAMPDYPVKNWFTDAEVAALEGGAK